MPTADSRETARHSRRHPTRARGTLQCPLPQPFNVCRARSRRNQTIATPGDNVAAGMKPFAQHPPFQVEAARIRGAARSPQAQLQLPPVAQPGQRRRLIPADTGALDGNRGSSIGVTPDARFRRRNLRKPDDLNPGQHAVAGKLRIEAPFQRQLDGSSAMQQYTGRAVSTRARVHRIGASETIATKMIAAWSQLR